MKKVLITISVLLLTACSSYKELPSDNEGINNNNKMFYQVKMHLK